MKKIKRKKGFTLVELIVVVAIIGALAAILIPAMLGYVIKARISNANTAAGKIRDSVSYFLLKADADGYGMFVSRSAVCDAKITIINGTWFVNITDKNVFWNKYGAKWQGSGHADADTASAESSNCGEERFAYFLASNFPHINEGYIKMRLIGGACTCLYFTQEQTTEVTEMPEFGGYTGWADEEFEWNGSNQGITSGGIIVGTSPLLGLEE